MSLLDLKELMDEVGIDPRHFPSIAGYLRLLRHRHEDTYNHVLRVGRLAATMAEYADIPVLLPK